MTDATWARISDERDRRFSSQPIVLGGGARLSSLAFCSRYNRDAHYADIADSGGILHWVTQKQMRIHGIIARMAVTHEHGTMRDMAREAQCCPATVSRAIVKLQGWGLFAIDVVRGRNGGVQIRAGRLETYVLRARAKLREWAQKVRDRAQKLNVSSKRDVRKEQEEDYLKRGSDLKQQLLVVDETFTAFMAWREENGAPEAAGAG